MKHNADGPQASEPTGEVPIRVLIAPLLPYPQFSDSSDTPCLELCFAQRTKELAGEFGRIDKRKQFTVHVCSLRDASGLAQSPFPVVLAFPAKCRRTFFLLSRILTTIAGNRRQDPLAGCLERFSLNLPDFRLTSADLCATGRKITLPWPYQSSLEFEYRPWSTTTANDSTHVSTSTPAADHHLTGSAINHQPSQKRCPITGAVERKQHVGPHRCFKPTDPLQRTSQEDKSPALTLES
jgi:hypothetical protein